MALPLARFLKFGVVGASGVIVNYGVYVPATRWFGVRNGPAYAAALLVSIFTNFLLNELWTFHDRRSGGRIEMARRMGQFYVVSLAGAVINWGVFWVCFRLLGVPDLLAILVGIALATGWNFGLNLVWTWRRRD